MVYKLLLSYILQDPASVEKEVIVPQDFKSQQDDHYLMPETYATNENRSPQFRGPGASSPKVPKTTIYNTPAISMPDVHPAYADPHSREQVKYYANWLAKQAKYD